MSLVPLGIVSRTRKLRSDRAAVAVGDRLLGKRAVRPLAVDELFPGLLSGRITDDVAVGRRAIPSAVAPARPLAAVRIAGGHARLVGIGPNS